MFADDDDRKPRPAEVELTQIVMHTSTKTQVVMGPSPTEESFALVTSERTSPLQEPMTIIRSQSCRAVVTAMDKLSQVSAVKLQEKRDNFEACTGIEQNNTYIISDSNDHQLFLVKEDSTCFERTFFCGCPDWKPWRMDLFNIPREGLDADHGNAGEHMLHLRRYCNVVCCCLCRPTVFAMGPDSRMLGKIQEPRSRLSYTYSVMHVGGDEILVTEPPWCHAGRCCRCPGLEVTVPVVAFSKERVGEVKKKWAKGDCCPCFFTDWPEFFVDFHDDASADIKLLLISLAVVMQMRHFDSR